MAGRLEPVDGSNWEAFLSAPAAYLMLGKTDCPACAAWTEELEALLQDPEFWPAVRFGKMLIDRPGLLHFKKANPWLAQVTDLPFNLLYRDRVKIKEWAGGGGERLVKRLARVFG